MEIKTKLNKWGLIKLKSFCTVKEIINKVESSEWEKIIANKITDKELISKIYKQHIQLDTKTNKQTNKQTNQKVGKRTKHICPKKTYREMPIKTIMSYHLTLARMAIIKKTPQTVNAGESVEEKESSCTVAVNVNDRATMRVWKFL